MRHPKSFPISPKLMTQCFNGIGHALQILDDGKPAVTRKTRKGVQKPPKRGGKQVMQKIVALSEKHGVTQVGKVTTAALREQMQQADAMEQIAMRARDLLTKADDTHFDADTTAWKMALALYMVLQRLAISDPVLQNDLEAESILTFFSKKARSTKKQEKASVASPGTKATAPTAAASGTLHASVDFTAPVIPGSAASNGVTNGHSNGAPPGPPSSQRM